MDVNIITQALSRVCTDKTDLSYINGGKYAGWYLRPYIICCRDSAWDLPAMLCTLDEITDPDDVDMHPDEEMLTAFQAFDPKITMEDLEFST